MHTRSGTALVAVASLLLGSTVATAAVPGAPVTVQGKVVDAAGQPIAGASVHAARTDRFGLTDANGSFTLTGVPSGSVAVVAAKEGYEFESVVRSGSEPVTIRLDRQVTPPRPEYPRPGADRRPFTNNAWLSLNGTWSFDFDQTDIGEAQGWFSPTRTYGKAIQVPFSYQSLAAFGEQALATDEVYRSAFEGYNGPVWYRRGFTVPAGFAGQNTRLLIGAAYWGFTIWLDGSEVQPYVDAGEVEWAVDLGALQPGSTHTLVIKVIGRPASATSPFPIGRQDLFANKGGIWQSVWIEPVKPGRLHTPFARPNLTFDGNERTPSAASVTVGVTGSGAPTGTVDVVIKDPDGAQVASGSMLT